ncbi:MAG: ABC transporter transmembrane domain-containing protein [Chryseolinea sp.]
MAKRNIREGLKEEEKRPVNRETLSQMMGIFRFALPYKGWFIIGLVALVFSSSTMLAFPYLAGELLDVANGVPVPYFDSIAQVALALIGVLFLQGIFSFTRVYTFALVTERSLADLRKAVYEKLVRLSLTFFDNHRIGELMSRITSDVGTLAETFGLTLAELLRQFATLIFGSAIILVLAPRLTGFMLLTFPVLVLIALVFGKFIRKMSRKSQDKLAEANVVVEESLQSITVVKAFTNEEFETNRYGKALEEVVNVSIRTARFRGLFISFIIFALFGGIVAVGWYGASLVASHTITVGELFSFVFYTSFIGASIAGLGDNYTQLQRAIGASERLREILQEPTEFDQVAIPSTADVQKNGAKQVSVKPAFRLNGKIDFRKVTFAYPTRKDVVVLKDLDFSIAPGEKVALVGRSGSGKSTIISLLMRFYEPDNGGIYTDDIAIADINLAGYRRNVGIVPQEVILFGGSIRDNIAYAKPGATLEEVQEAARQANALEFIETFPDKFDTLVGERGVKLSGGQRQRIAIARAILKDPAILILDEATSSLDVHSEVLVQQALEKLMEGRTSIIIAHRLSTIKKVDRIFVIQEGRLAEMGSHAELTQVDNGIYSNLLKLQLT